jgi:hypothetical protein
MTILPTPKSTSSLSPEQIEAILAELNAILAGGNFSGSKRCLEFLDFIVRRAIAGDYEHLSERFLGVELFGRPLDYETSSDAIVRVRANDVRRRLAQHYSEQHSISGVTIGLASGSYIPEFQWHESGEPEHAAVAELHTLAAESTTETAASKSTDRSKARRLLRPGIGAIALLLVAGILGAVWIHRTIAPKSALERFWEPVINSKSVVTMRFGETISYWISPELRKTVEENQKGIVVNPGDILESWDDSLSAGSIRAALSIADLLSRHGIPSRIRWPKEIQEQELARANVIYIGGFNNSWTMSLNHNLRFAFQETDMAGEHQWMICDRNHPGRQWSMTKTYPQPVDHDYALITRILDPDRKRVIISLGGMNQFGTQAAADFLTDEAAMAAFARIAPRGWERKNLQIVLEMEVSGSRVVNPRMVDFATW